MHAHLFYTTKKKIVDKELEIFAKNSENCCRKMLLESIGGSLKDRNGYGCSPDFMFNDILQVQSVKRAVRNVEDNLKQKVIAVREKVYRET